MLLQMLCCKLFVLKYFYRTSTLRKFFNTKIFPTKISWLRYIQNSNIYLATAFLLVSFQSLWPTNKKLHMPILPAVSLFHIYLRSDFLSKSLFTDGLIAREVQFSLTQPVSLPPLPISLSEDTHSSYIWYNWGKVMPDQCLPRQYKNHTALHLSDMHIYFWENRGPHHNCYNTQNITFVSGKTVMHPSKFLVSHNETPTLPG